MARSPFDGPTVERLLAHVEPDPVSDDVALVISLASRVEATPSACSFAERTSGETR
jgi:hypothetical protein